MRTDGHSSHPSFCRKRIRIGDHFFHTHFAPT
jgi:hypothetical protein